MRPPGRALGGCQFENFPGRHRPDGGDGRLQIVRKKMFFGKKRRVFVLPCENKFVMIKAFVLLNRWHVAGWF